MPWCPKCKNEYVNGVETCVDCGCALVESLTDQQKTPIYFGEEELLERMMSFLEYNKIKSASIQYNEEEQLYELFVTESDEERAKRVIFIFLQQKQQEENQVIEKVQEEIEKQETYSGVYEDSAKKAEEYKSGAYTLLFIGGLGIVAIILFYLDLLPIHIAGMSKYLMAGVMGTLFVLFFIMGILSFKSFKKLEIKAVKENNLTDTLNEWCLQNLTMDKIDGELDIENIAPELQYFQRTEYIKELINTHFMNLKPDFLDDFIEKIYPTIFGE